MNFLINYLPFSIRDVDGYFITVDELGSLAVISNAICFKRTDSATHDCFHYMYEEHHFALILL